MNDIESLVLDIDDTLADTARYTFELAKQFFPHALSVDELLRIYRQPGDVPEWQTASVRQWLENHLGSIKYLNTIPQIKGSQQAVINLSKFYPIGCYITSRQHYMKEITLEWLARHEFPPAPVITRSFDVTAQNWKFAELKRNFSQPLCLIDDSLGDLTDEMFVGAPAKLFWYNPMRSLAHNNHITNCLSWVEIENILLL